MPKVKQRLATCWECEVVLLDASRAAMLLGVNVQQVRKLAREGQIPAVKLGVKLWRFNKYALMEWAGVKES